jgi:hypothetical protein
VSDACRGDAVLTYWQTDDAVESVVFSDGGIIGSLPAGAPHISSSTISVALSETAVPRCAGVRPSRCGGRGQILVIAAGPKKWPPWWILFSHPIGQKN